MGAARAAVDHGHDNIMSAQEMRKTAHNSKYWSSSSSQAGSERVAMGIRFGRGWLAQL